MRILVTNDDGIKAEGIQHLTAALASVAEVFVLLPIPSAVHAATGLRLRFPSR